MSEMIIVSGNVIDIHRKKIKYIINYIIKKYGLADNIIARGIIGGFLIAVDNMSDADTEDIWQTIERIVNK